MVKRDSSNSETWVWTGSAAIAILEVSGVAGVACATARQEVDDRMIRVLVMGEHAVATMPVHAALAGRADVETVSSVVGPSARGVDAVVMDESFDAASVAERLDVLSALHPDARLVVVALQRADRYRWVRVLPNAARFAVRGAGNDTLDDIVEALLDDLRADDLEAHDALPTMPRSIA